MVQLSRDSTLWPCLLLLRFRTDDGKIMTLPILPDCVSPHSFRALLVACRWVATQNNLDDAHENVRIGADWN